MRQDRHASKRHRPAVEPLEGRALLSVGFARASYSAHGHDGTVTLTLSRKGSRGAFEMVEVVPLAGSTAVAGLDYSPFARNVTFTPGTATRQVRVRLIHGDHGRGTRALRLALRPLTPGAVAAGPSGLATVAIAHDHKAGPRPK